MLFGYPVAAAEENWLHECIRDAILGIQRCHTRGEPVPEWIELIPAAHRAKLSRRDGLGHRLTAYSRVDAKLSAEERDAVATALDQQNQIAELLSCRADCARLVELPEGVRVVIRDLFTFGFRLLSDLEIRDRQYEIIYEYLKELDAPVCPFCGYEAFSAPTGPREALDHYLAESIYPFAGLNLRNLIPMGGKCNGGYKLDQDVLRRPDGTRRRVVDPYNNVLGLQVSVNRSKLNEHGSKPLISEWIVEFTDATEETETWAEVFSIRKRYAEDVLTPWFTSWMTEFQIRCARIRYHDESAETVILALTNYIEDVEKLGFKDHNFLKAAVFRMLLRFCEEGNARVFAFVADLVKGF